MVAPGCWQHGTWGTRYWEAEEWEYAFDFISSFHTIQRHTDCVRRKKWTRNYIVPADHRGLVISGATKHHLNGVYRPCGKKRNEKDVYVKWNPALLRHARPGENCFGIIQFSSSLELKFNGRPENETVSKTLGSLGAAYVYVNVHIMFVCMLPFSDPLFGNSIEAESRA